MLFKNYYRQILIIIILEIYVINSYESSKRKKRLENLYLFFRSQEYD